SGDGSGGNLAAGIVWYQYATDEISSCNGRNSAPLRGSPIHPSAWIVTRRSRVNLTGSAICQRYIPNLCCDAYSPSGRITCANPAYGVVNSRYPPLSLPTSKLYEPQK